MKFSLIVTIKPALVLVFLMRVASGSEQGRGTKVESHKIHANLRSAKWGALAKFAIIHAWETPKLSGARLTPILPTLARRREKDVWPSFFENTLDRLRDEVTNAWFLQLQEIFTTYQNVYEKIV